MSTEIEVIKKLRQQTGAGFTECKKAYVEADGDLEKAMSILKVHADKTVEKKSSREIKAGLVGAYIHAAGKVGALVRVGCETDFVSKNDDFKNLVHDIAMHIAAMNPENEEDLLGQPFVKNPSVTVKDFIQEAIVRIGENIKVEDFSRFEI